MGFRSWTADVPGPTMSSPSVAGSQMVGEWHPTVLFLLGLTLLELVLVGFLSRHLLR